MGDGFTTALDELEQTANKYLPALRGIVAEARDIVQGTTTDQDAAFNGDLYAPLADAWESLRNGMTSIQDQLIQRIEQCEQALRDVAARYRETDSAGAAEVDAADD
jgi:uncharacterized protein YukE